jgi:putative transposase
VGTARLHPGGAGDRHQQRRVSLAALLCIKPGQRPRLIYRVHHARRRRTGQRKGFSDTGYARLLDAAHQQLGGPLVVVWDNSNARHEAPP